MTWLIDGTNQTRWSPTYGVNINFQSEGLGLYWNGTSWIQGLYNISVPAMTPLTPVPTPVPSPSPPPPPLMGGTGGHTYTAVEGPLETTYNWTAGGAIQFKNTKQSSAKTAQSYQDEVCLGRNMLIVMGDARVHPPASASNRRRNLQTTSPTNVPASPIKASFQVKSLQIA